MRSRQAAWKFVELCLEIAESGMPLRSVVERERQGRDERGDLKRASSVTCTAVCVSGMSGFHNIDM